ncbi:hypothetical protein [Burkholderia pseudomultivorans]|uniref:hypothetical protein n=1 Tax=Burkholderia pseudomultivorans TaxID=1207504 RepID=UPI000754F518|nr:hypothetical protein [Burkholderia pseudomultivorans]KVG64935.1 hypothetical protein WS80_15970 [Burkholderia pseudomultivorans]
MARKSGSKYFKYVAIFVLCFVAACYMVPEYPDYPRSDRSMVDEMKLDGAGDKLLVRTKQYDYDFALGDRTLSAALAPLRHSSPAQPSDTPWYAHGELSDLQIQPDGSFSSRLTVSFIGYDPDYRPTDIGLPDDEIARLEKYGFTRTRTNFGDAFGATWSADVVGHRHARGSLGTYAGADLLTCCGTEVNEILDTQEKIAHNRRLNAMLRPVTVVTDAVRHVIAGAALVVVLLFGGDLGLPRG